MLGDFLKSVLPGRGREAIIAQLGLPEPHSSFADPQNLVYKLGPQRSLAIGPGSERLLLLIVDGRCQRHQIRGD